uniref:Phosphatidylethanolamine-binding protein n=1 Tax=Acrobeloides nanus TaxID=290746 RepID=A0A914CKM4_9BILA
MLRDVDSMNISKIDIRLKTTSISLEIIEIPDVASRNVINNNIFDDRIRATIWDFMSLRRLEHFAALDIRLEAPLMRPVEVEYFLIMSIQESFKRSHLVPDLLPKPPKKALHVRLPTGEELTPDKKVDISKLKREPNVSWDGNPEKLYTLIMADPDFPSHENPAQRDYIHWMAVNIPGNNLNDADLIVPYTSATPPEHTGPHRYALMVCEQHNGRMGIFGVRAKREGFPVKKFIQDHCLEPVAGTFVEAQID